MKIPASISTLSIATFQTFASGWMKVRDRFITIYLQHLITQ